MDVKVVEMRKFKCSEAPYCELSVKVIARPQVPIILKGLILCKKAGKSWILFPRTFRQGALIEIPDDSGKRAFTQKVVLAVREFEKFEKLEEERKRRFSEPPKRMDVSDFF